MPDPPARSKKELQKSSQDGEQSQIAEGTGALSETEVANKKVRNSIHISGVFFILPSQVIYKLTTETLTTRGVGPEHPEFKELHGTVRRTVACALVGTSPSFYVLLSAEDMCCRGNRWP